MLKTSVNFAAAVTLIVSLSACATNRKPPQELSQELPQSAFNDDNWDTYRSDRQVRTLDRDVETFASKARFKERVSKAGKTGKKTSTAAN